MVLKNLTKKKKIQSPACGKEDSSATAQAGNWCEGSGVVGRQQIKYDSVECLGSQKAKKFWSGSKRMLRISVLRSLKELPTQV